MRRIIIGLAVAIAALAGAGPAAASGTPQSPVAVGGLAVKQPRGGGFR